jgi:hypothetical protein
MLFEELGFLRVGTLFVAISVRNICETILHNAIASSLDVTLLLPRIIVTD